MQHRPSLNQNVLRRQQSTTLYNFMRQGISSEGRKSNRYALDQLSTYGSLSNPVETFTVSSQCFSNSSLLTLNDRCLIVKSRARGPSLHLLSRLLLDTVYRKLTSWTYISPGEKNTRHGYIGGIVYCLDFDRLRIQEYVE